MKEMWLIEGSRPKNLVHVTPVFLFSSVGLPCFSFYKVDDTVVVNYCNNLGKDTGFVIEFVTDVFVLILCSNGKTRSLRSTPLCMFLFIKFLFLVEKEFVLFWF